VNYIPQLFIFFIILIGIICDGRVYSDCLYAEFIDSINEQILSKTITYDQSGIT